MRDAKGFLANKKFLLSLSVVVLVGVSVVWGLKMMTYSSVSSSVEVETTYGPIKLTLRLNKTTYTLGELVNVNVTVTNISNETIVLGFSMPPELDLCVYNESSVVIYGYACAYGWHCAFVDVVLDPEESYVCTRPLMVWDQVEIEKFPPYTHIQVPPGTYHITGRTGPCLWYIRSNPYKVSGSIIIETPRVEI